MLYVYHTNLQIQDNTFFWTVFFFSSSIYLTNKNVLPQRLALSYALQLHLNTATHSVASKKPSK